MQQYDRFGKSDGFTKQNDRNEPNETNEDPLMKVTPRKVYDPNTFTPISTFKPEGNIVYSRNIFSKIEGGHGPP